MGGFQIDLKRVELGVESRLYGVFLCGFDGNWLCFFEICFWTGFKNFFLSDFLFKFIDYGLDPRFLKKKHFQKICSLITYKFSSRKILYIPSTNKKIFKSAQIFIFRKGENLKNLLKPPTKAEISATMRKLISIFWFCWFLIDSRVDNAQSR